MLKVDEIIYPITFHFYNPSMVITFTDKKTGIWDSGRKTQFPVDYFVENHYCYNPHNEACVDYYYKMNSGYFFAKDGKAHFGSAHIARGIISANSKTICKIEDLPVGATIKGIKRNKEGWDDVTFTPRRIEIHDDMITLLSGYAGGYSKDGNNYALEINIKRGTKVKIKNSTNC